MSDLHEARDPERKSQIDTVGWLFLAFALASVTAAAAMVAYKANDTMVANTTVSRALVRVNLFEGAPKYTDLASVRNSGTRPKRISSKAVSRANPVMHK